ncbi:MAG TPA: ABC transporter permease [Alphaproteobacteria bacterium]|nr:ABC transporter permease [Alphaproteobacteria bacterium]
MSVTAGRRLGLWLLLAPAALWLGLLVLIPLFDMLLVSVQVKVSPRVYRFGLENYAEFFLEEVYWNTFFRTAVISIAATALTLVAAFPVAYYIAKIARGRSRDVLFVLCLLPFWVSELVRTFGWMILLRETGVASGFLQWIGVTNAPIEFLYNDAAIVIGLVYTSILFMIVPLVTVLDSLDDSIVEAAYDLGGSGPAILREIVVPHAMPGIVGGTIVVFMLTLGNYLTSTLLGGKNSLWFTEQIYNQFITRFNWEQGSAFGFLLLALSSLIIWFGLRLTGQSLAKTLG